MCVECKQAARPAPREPRRNPAGHRISCACSAACRAYRVNLTREWRLKNPDGKRAQDARYRARYREEINEKSAARARTEERREWVRQWMDENREKVREQGRAQYRRNPERHRESTRAWREANADYYREVQRWHREERARVITPRAINSRTPWTEAELRIALDPSLTLAEAALMLGRTVSAVGGKRHKVRMSAS